MTFYPLLMYESDETMCIQEHDFARVTRMQAMLLQLHDLPSCSLLLRSHNATDLYLYSIRCGEER